jgi:2-deoxy-D-gluconate 3-dehydrogenase
MSDDFLVRLFGLHGKKAIVTGGAAGLGKAMVEALSRAGAEVAVIDLSAQSPVHDEEELSGRPNVHSISADLGSRQELGLSFERAVSLLGGIDILINSAGTQARHKSEEFPLDDWDKVIEVNLTAVFELCQLAGRLMLNRGAGKIINVASMLSFSGGLTVPAYAASKGGVAQLTKTLANEWGGRGVNVNALAPGWMATALTSALVGNPDREPDILKRITAGRWGQPADIQGAAVFLASEASDYLHGVILPVDGGYLAR